MRRSASGHLVPLFVAVAVLFLTAWARQPSHAQQTFGEEFARQLIRAALSQYFDPASSFEISVSRPTLTGQVLAFESLLIEGSPAIFRGIRGEMLLHASELQVDVDRWINRQAIGLVRAGRATLVARSTAKEVQEGLTRASPILLNPKVRFSLGQFEISATIKRADKLYPAQARGSLTVDRHQRIHVVITHASVQGRDVPPNIVESELARANPILDLSRFPLTLEIQRLVLHNDRIEFLATSGR